MAEFEILVLAGDGIGPEVTAEGVRALEAVGEKVAALFPEHEVEEFTGHFWGLIQFWRKTEAERIGLTAESDR